MPRSPNFLFADPNSSSEFWDRTCRIARYHRWVILSLAIRLGVAISTTSYLLLSDSPDALMQLTTNSIAEVFFFLIHLFMVVSLVMLARELTSNTVAIICGIVAVVPSSSILLVPMLIIFYLMATKYLKNQGFVIGLFGVNPNAN